jgi:hypothetical protein
MDFKAIRPGDASYFGSEIRDLLQEVSRPGA